MPPTTRIILDTFTDAAVQGRIGRQLPRLFTLAGLTDMSVTPTVILSNAAFWRILYQDHVAPAPRSASAAPARMPAGGGQAW